MCFHTCRPLRLARAKRLRSLGLLLALTGIATWNCAWAAPDPVEATPAGFGHVARQLVKSAAQDPGGQAVKGRIEVEVGALDPRLKLAPCQKVEPYLPAGQRVWGRMKVGLRCTSGPVAWNVYLPVIVHVWAPAVTAAGPIPADAELRAHDLTVSEVDVAERPSPTFDRLESLVGRRTAIALAPGATIRADVLKLRQWFGAGETVAVLAVGDGFSVSSEAQALSPGLEGQAVRLRTESGRIITAMPVGERRAEMRP